MINRFLVILTLLAVASLGLAACTLAGEPVPAGPIQTGPLPGEVVAANLPVSLPRAAQGELIYLENCAACHGPDGSGQSDMAEQIAQQGGQLPDFTDPALARSRSPQDWYRTITAGNIQALMPPWQDALSDAQRWDVAYYLYTLSTPPDAIDQGRALYSDLFAAEFGAAGEQVGLDNLGAVAELSPQDLYDQYLADRGGDLTDAERWAVVAYMQTFGYDPALAVVALDAPGPGPAEVEAAAEESPAEATAEAPAEEPAAEAPAEEAAAPDAGVVSGQIAAATPGMSLPDGLEVSLRGVAVDANNQVFEFLARSTTAGPDGSFRFEDVPFDMPRSAYVVEVIYDGVTFSNGQIIDPTRPSMELPITLYGNTTDPAVVSVDAMHLVIRAHPDALLVTQLYVFSNTGDRIYVSQEPVSGGRRGSVAISLPPDAYGMSFEEGQIGGRFIQVGDRIYDTDQLLPGSRTQAIIVNYFLPFDGPREVSIPILYRTAQVTVLAQEGQTARSEQLNDAGVEVIEQAAYNKYLGSDFAPGDTLTFRLQPSGAASNTLLVVLLGVVGVLLVGGGVYWAVQRRGLLPEPVAAGISPREEALIREMAQLDDAFEAGRINRFEYEARRADLKATLAGEAGGEDG